MKKTIYYMYKPGDARDYAMTTRPSPEWSIVMAEQGFKLFECLVDIPADDGVKLEGYGDEAAPVEEIPLVRSNFEVITPDTQPVYCTRCGASAIPGEAMQHLEKCDAMTR